MVDVMKLTDGQLKILRHMLGIDMPDVKDPKPYRDYYCAKRGDENLAELEILGAVRLYRQCQTYDWYCCTECGRAAAIASHKRIRLPKGKRLYRRFLDMRGVIQNITFKEFLTEKQYDATRRSA